MWMDGRTDGRTDGQTDMMKLLVAFRNYASASKPESTIIAVKSKGNGYQIVIRRPFPSRV